MDTTNEFRRQFLDNQPELVNSEDRETLLMKAYALYYHDNKVINKSDDIRNVIRPLPSDRVIWTICKSESLEIFSDWFKKFR